VDACFTPRLLAALDDLMGAGRWNYAPRLGWWPISFPGFEAPPWQEPQEGWHVDGQQFHHHLNSPAQGLLSIFLFSDIAPGDGGTALSLGSHRVTTQVLAAAEPSGLDVYELLKQVNMHPRERVVECTGEAGDVALMHPFISHARSANTGRRVRFICNPCFSLKQPMNLQDENSDDYSPVEVAIVEALKLAANHTSQS
jgi:ectoine hydroxylase-related dioxygenase (phytanoyl-CoA dioxygenase family)